MWRFFFVMPYLLLLLLMMPLAFFHFSLSMYRFDCCVVLCVRVNVCWCSRQPMDILSFVCHRLITESYPDRKKSVAAISYTYHNRTPTRYNMHAQIHSYTLSTQFIALARHHLKFGELFDLVFVLSRAHTRTHTAHLMAWFTHIHSMSIFGALKSVG